MALAAQQAMTMQLLQHSSIVQDSKVCKLYLALLKLLQLCTTLAVTVSYSVSRVVTTRMH